MSLSSKLTLENKIFARANQLQAAVHGYGGKLISSSDDTYLQALLGLYNAYFYAENFTRFCAHENPLEAYALFKQSGGVFSSHTTVLNASRSWIELLF